MEPPGQLGAHAERPRHRRLDRRDMAHHDDVAARGAGAEAVGGEELVAGGGHAGVDLGQRLASRGSKAGIPLPLPPYVGRDVAQGLTLVLAVVHLHPTFVHLDRDAGMAKSAAVSRARLSGLVRSARTGSRNS